MSKKSVVKIYGPPPTVETIEGGYHYTCPGCGCKLSSYEAFASRLSGLERPICMGCAYKAVVFMRDELVPMLEKALEHLEKMVTEDGE